MFSRLASAIADCISPAIEEEVPSQQTTPDVSPASHNTVGLRPAPPPSVPTQQPHHPSPIQTAYLNNNPIHDERLPATTLPALPALPGGTPQQEATPQFAITRTGLMRMPSPVAPPATPPERAELTKARDAAQKNPARFLNTVVPEDFSDAEKEDLACTVMKEDPEQFCRALLTFGFEGEAKDRMLKEYAQSSPLDFLNDIHRLKLPDGSLQVELAKLLAEKIPVVLCSSMMHFNIDNEDERLEVAQIALAQIETHNLSVYTFGIGPTGFNISSPDKRLALANQLMDSQPDLLGEIFNTFEFDEDTRKRMAEAMLQSDPASLARNFDRFGINDAKERFKLAEKCVPGAPYLVATNIGKFDIEDEGDRITLADSIIKAGGGAGFASSVKGFKISKEEERIRLARAVAEKAPTALGRCLRNFDIEDQKVLNELAGVAAQHAPVDAANYLLGCQRDNNLIKDVEKRKDLIMEAYSAALYVCNENELRLHFGYFSDCPGLDSLASAVEQYGNKSKNFAELKSAAMEEKNEHIRNILLDWIHRTAIRFRKVEDAVVAQAAPFLKHIQKWRAPDQRDDITRVLFEQCVGPKEEDAKAFLDFAGRLKNTNKFQQGHSTLLPILLFPLCKDASDQAPVNTLAAMRLKNASNLKPVIAGLLGMINATKVKVELKKKWLKNAVAQVTAHKQLVQTLVVLGQFVSLANENTVTGQNMLRLLEENDDIDALMGAAVKELFMLEESDNTDALSRFRQYQSNARNASALIAYAANANNELRSPDKEAVLDAMRQYVQSAILGDEHAFHKVRYDTTDSPHLETIAKGAPDAWQKWQEASVLVTAATDASSAARETDIHTYLHRRLIQDGHFDINRLPELKKVLNREQGIDEALASLTPSNEKHRLEISLLQLLKPDATAEERIAVIDSLAHSLADLIDDEINEQFQQDLTDLRTLLAAPKSKGQAYSTWKVVDTDAPEDLLLCGTEVVGSCQNLYGNLQYNKAIFGYVMDGKYRMLAVKSPDGRTQSRAMLRLMWANGRPVLHLERRYGNAGVPAALQDGIVELAKQKARAMTCPLVTHEDEYQPGDELGEKIESGQNRWPFEYVDAADDNGVHSRGAPYSFTTARVLAMNEERINHRSGERQAERSLPQ